MKVCRLQHLVLSREPTKDADQDTAWFSGKRSVWSIACLSVVVCSDSSALALGRLILRLCTLVAPSKIIGLYATSEIHVVVFARHIGSNLYIIENTR